MPTITYVTYVCFITNRSNLKLGQKVNETPYVDMIPASNEIELFDMIPGHKSKYKSN